jgi:hypothetical protein
VSERIEDEILTEARRAISTQVASLDELRGRTGLLLAAATVTGSFLGSLASDHPGDFGCAGIGAVVAFAAAVLCCLNVLRTRFSAWTVVTSPKVLAQDWLDIDRGDASMQRFLAESLEDHYEANKVQIDRLFIWFSAAAFSVGLEVILGILQLSLT